MGRCWFIFIIFGLFRTIIARHTGKEPIIDGNSTLPGELKYMVSINFNDDHICGGSIIDERFVITAAHCCINIDDIFIIGSYKIVTGINDLYADDPERIEIYVEKIYVPTIYNGSLARNLLFGDIAILKLKERLDLEKNTNVMALQLPRKTDTFEGNVALISGFGWDVIHVSVSRDGTVEEFGSLNGKLYKANTFVLGATKCKSYYPKMNDSHLCARMKKKKKERFYGVCSGDSGGPLVYKSKIIIGLLSASGYGCDESIDPGLYTRVSAYVDFINRAMTDDETNIRTLVIQS